MAGGIVSNHNLVADCAKPDNSMPTNFLSAVIAVQKRVYKAIGITDGPWLGEGKDARDTPVLIHLMACQPCWEKMVKAREKLHKGKP